MTECDSADIRLSREITKIVKGSGGFCVDVTAAKSFFLVVAMCWKMSAADVALASRI